MTVRATRTCKSLTAAKVLADSVKISAKSPDRRYAIDPPSMAEPSLRDMLRDPVVQHVMRSDGVDAGDLLALMRTARVRIYH